VLPPKKDYFLDITIPNPDFQRAARLPRKKSILEVDFFMVPTPIGTRGERAQLPYMLLVVEAKSGLILAPEMLEISGTVMATMAQIPALLTRILLGMGYLPAEIHTKSERLTLVLNGWANELKIPGRNKSRLPALDSAKQSMLSFLG